MSASTAAHKSDDGDKTIDDEKPGTSTSVSALQGTNDGPSGSAPAARSQGHESSSESSPTAFLKARNASRSKPPEEIPETKRQRISQNQDNDGENDDVDEGIRMDTESSSSDDDPARENPNEPVDVDSVDEDADLLPTRQLPKASTRRGSSSRRSSNAEEGVSTTIPVSSRGQRPEQFEDQPDSHARQFVLEEAIASTSAAAMAPPLSRLMENSPVIENLYRFPIFERGESRQEINVQRRPGRDSTPAPGTSGYVENLYFHEGMDVNENRGPEAFLQKMHGKQRLMWARKLFFLSTELVFPGFKACSEKTQIPEYMGVRVRSSVMMQALLYADVLFFLMWILSFLCNCDILITVLKQLHGYLSICLTCLFILVNIFRLRFGLKGNENDEVQYLALFWMTTVIVQIPLFTFIFLTDLFCPVLMAFTVTMDGAMMVFILLESVVGFIHFRSLLRDELNIIRMARRSKESSQSRANIMSSSHRSDEGVAESLGISKLNLARNVASADGDSSSDTDSENRFRTRNEEQMDFRMHIRRLSEPRRSREDEQANVDEDDDSDSSEQVTSTSDTIRQRPIRAH